jgi:hypothetical protein
MWLKLRNAKKAQRHLGISSKQPYVVQIREHREQTAHHPKKTVKITPYFPSIIKTLWNTQHSIYLRLNPCVPDFPKYTKTEN